MGCREKPCEVWLIPTLDVVVPNVTVDFPTNDSDHGAWLQKLTTQEAECQRAFFGTSREIDLFFL